MFCSLGLLQWLLESIAVVPLTSAGTGLGPVVSKWGKKKLRLTGHIWIHKEHDFFFWELLGGITFSPRLHGGGLEGCSSVPGVMLLRQ